MNENPETEKVPADSAGTAPFDIPLFLRRDLPDGTPMLVEVKDNVERITEVLGPPPPAVEHEPNESEIILLIKRLAEKQTAIEIKKNELKEQLVKKIWRL